MVRKLLLNCAMARKLEELPIHRNAVEFCCEVTALLDRPAFGRNRKLRDQIDSANDSILSNMSEGFEQPTDKAVEKYLFDAKGSAAEVLACLETAISPGATGRTGEGTARHARDPIQDKDSR